MRRRSLLLYVWAAIIAAAVLGSLAPMRVLTRLHLDGQHVNHKMLHFLGYAILGCLPLVALGPRRTAMPCAGAMVALGICLELLQRLLPGRSPSFTDILANTAGIAAGIALALVSPSKVLRAASDISSRFKTYMAAPSTTTPLRKLTALSSAEQPRGNHFWRDAVISVTWAHLCFLKLWTAHLTYTSTDAFFMKHPPSTVAVAALLVNTPVLACVLWGALRASRAKPSSVRFKVSVGILLAGGLVLLNGLREVFSSALGLSFLRFEMFSVLGPKGTILGTALGGMVFFYAGIRSQRALLRFAIGSLLVLSPIVPLTLVAGIYAHARRNNAAFEEPIHAPLLTTARPQRALWIIFDEWDQRLTFDDRPAGVNLPEVERFRRSAVFATSAYPPANDTIVSVPSLLAGRVFASASVAGPNNLQLSVGGNPRTIQWGAEPNIISKSRQSGLNVAIVGWYLPYCRVFGDSAGSCSWTDLSVQSSSLGSGFGQVAVNEFRTLLETNLLSPFGQSLSTAQHARNYTWAVDKAVAAASDPAIGLTIVHLPATHVPYFFDRFSSRSTRSNSLVSGYPDGLVVADRTLACIRQKMEQRGLWDRTTVLLSSDHSFRHSAALDGKYDRRVPFLLKMPGQQSAITYEPGFNTVLSSDLLSATLTGALSRGTDVPGWIDWQRTLQKK